MRFTVSGSIVRFEPNYKNCTVSSDGVWIPFFVPDSLADQIRLNVDCQIEFVLKCKFAKGHKPYIYLVLRGLHYE